MRVTGQFRGRVGMLRMFVGGGAEDITEDLVSGLACWRVALAARGPKRCNCRTSRPTFLRGYWYAG